MKNSCLDSKNLSNLEIINHVIEECNEDKAFKVVKSY